jgi:hypothetical protein
MVTLPNCGVINGCRGGEREPIRVKSNPKFHRETSKALLEWKLQARCRRQASSGLFLFLSQHIGLWLAVFDFPRLD